MSARKAASGNKAKIARRVIEVLDYFDDAHREATVMDIVRRYDRPQSSTSELLSSLVELGLLRKDRHARTYSLTPRAALLGTGGQSAAVRDGRIVRLLDRLSAQTGLPVALFGMTGLSAQIYAWRPATRNGRRDYCRTVDGLQHPLTESAAGMLLLSTVAQPRRDGLVRRLNAEAEDARKFAFAEMAARIEACRESGEVRGPAGFGSKCEMVARLLPPEAVDEAMAVAVMYGRHEAVNADALAEAIGEAVHAMLDSEPGTGRVERLPSAA
jgi:DNA-binding IclR family transcriptional regulator